MVTAHFGPGEGGGSSVVGSLFELKKVESQEAEKTAALLNEALEIAQRFSRAEAGTESMSQSEATASRWRFYQKLSELKQGETSPEVQQKYTHLGEDFARLWNGVRERWFPREIQADMSNLISGLETYRSELIASHEDRPQTHIPASRIGNLLAEEIASGHRITDEDLYTMVHQSHFAGHTMTEPERRLMRSIASSLAADLPRAEKRANDWEAAVKEMHEMGWSIAGDNSAMRPLPSDYRGNPESTLQILKGSEAETFLRNQLESRAAIEKLKAKKEELEGKGEKGLFDGPSLWWVDVQLARAREKAQKLPSAWDQRSFRENSEVALFSHADGSIDLGEKALGRCGEDFAKRALSLELRWGAYVANLEGSTANAILMAENLDSVEHRRLGERKSYGSDFNRADLGAEMFRYALNAQPLLPFLETTAEVSAAQSTLPKVSELDRQMASTFAALYGSNGGEGAAVDALERFDDLLEKRDRAYVAEFLGAELAAATDRLRRRFAVDYRLDLDSPLLKPHAAPFIRGAADGMNYVMTEGYPTVVNKWFGCMGNPGMDHTPHANSFGSVPMVVYSVNLSVEGQSINEMVIKQIEALARAGALPAEIIGRTPNVLPAGKEGLGVQLYWEIKQPVQMSKASVKESIGLVEGWIEENLVRAINRNEGIQAVLLQHNVAFGISLTFEEPEKERRG